MLKNTFPQVMSDRYFKARYYCRACPVDEFTFLTFKAEGYTESALIRRGCPAVIFMLVHCA